MSLVCYGSSDSEDESEQKDILESDKASVCQSESKNVSESEEYSVNKAEDIYVPDFNSIPNPAVKKGRETVKITIPSLNQFKDEDIKIESKAKPTFKGGSGLLSMLPPPKYSGTATQRSFTPHILTKQKNTEKKVADIKSVPKKSSSESVKHVYIPKADKSLENTSTYNEDGDESTSFDFFSLESASKKIGIEENGNNEIHPQLPCKNSIFASLPEPIQSTSHTATPIFKEKATSLSVTSYSSAQSDNYTEDYELNENYQNAHSSDQPGWSENYQSVPNINQADAKIQLLKDKNFKKKLGQKEEDIQFIDVNADDQLTGKEQWLMQSLTEEKVHRPLKRKGCMPTQQQKRKHHITYLAFQAKEREMDLKNEWSLNRRTRRETQAKYGF